jgi:hypothetical protein
MKPKSAIAKGKILENMVADKLKVIDPTAHRQPGSGNGLAKGDISNNLGLCIECKNTARLNWKETAKQVERQAMGYAKEVVIWHAPRTPEDKAIVIIDLDFFIELMGKSKEPKTKEPDREFRYLLNNLKVVIQKVIKRLE